MYIPMQAPAVIRASGAVCPENRDYSVLPSQCGLDGCITGCWCCADDEGNASCHSCGSSPCLVPQLSFCHNLGLHPSAACGPC